MFDSESDLRELALGVGDLHGGIITALKEHIPKSKEERNRETRKALQQLRDSEYMTDAEAEQLGRILDLVGDDGTDEAEAATKVGEIHEDLKRKEAGALALAISSIAVDSTRSMALAAEDGKAHGAKSLTDSKHMSWSEADCEGGIIGATVGLVPGLLGLGPGAVAAGALGGAAAGSLAVHLSE